MVKKPDASFLGEHLPYELMMLRFTWQALNKEGGQPALHSYALFESFSVHARSLCEFLTNDDDQRLVSASDYNPEFEAKRTDLARGKRDRMNQQIMHIGTQRANDRPAKLDLEDIEELKDWIEKEFDRFIKELPANFAGQWKKELSQVPEDSSSIEIDPPTAFATNAPQFIKVNSQS